MTQKSTRRRFFGLVGAAAAGAAVAGVPSLEAATAAEFRQVGENGRAVALNAARRAYLGAVHPFFEPAPPVDLSQVDYGLAKAASIADDGVPRPFQYAVPVAASGSGMNGSVWETLIMGRVESDTQADIRARLTPRGRASTPDDPITWSLSVDGRASFRWEDPLLNLFGASGTGWLLIESSEPLSFNDSYTYNQAADGSQQGQAIPVFPLEDLAADARIAHAGDVQRFELYGTPDVSELPKRENWLMWQPDDAGTARLDYWIERADGGQVTTTLSQTLDPGEYLQLNGLHAAFPDYLVQPGDSLVVRVMSADGDSEVNVYQAVSHTDNATPECQDPMTDEGSISRGIESASIYRSSGEANDPKVSRISVNAGRKAVIEEIHIDWDGNGTYDEHITDINEQEYVREQTGAQNTNYGTWQPRMTVVFNNRRTGSVTRDFTGEAYTVTAEAEESFPIADVRDNMLGNLDSIADIFGDYVWYPDTTEEGVWYHRDAATWSSILPGQLSDKVTGVRWRDQHNTLVFQNWNGLGDFEVYIKGGTEAENTMRRLYDLITQPPQ